MYDAMPPARAQLGHVEKRASGFFCPLGAVSDLIGQTVWRTLGTFSRVQCDTLRVVFFFLLCARRSHFVMVITVTEAT